VRTGGEGVGEAGHDRAAATVDTDGASSTYAEVIRLQLGNERTALSIRDLEDSARLDWAA
jgi:hypothetical protein